MGSMTLPKVLPKINFSSQDLTPGSTSWASTCKQVRHALENYGCFVALYPQVSPHLINNVFGHSKDLFSLPLETKLKNTTKVPYRGYIAPIPVMPHYEAIGIDNVTSPQATHNFSNLMWPEGNTEFCGTLNLSAKLLANLEHTVEKMIFESYAITDEKYNSMASSNSHLIRFLKYKKPQKRDAADVRFAGHTDQNFTTIVVHHDVAGLEIETKDGEWISVESARSEVLFMAGEGLEAWSNGRVKACNHRVKDRGEEIRYALAMFTFNNGDFQVPQELVDERHPPIFCTKEEAMRLELRNRLLSGVGNAELSIFLNICGVANIVWS